MRFASRIDTLQKNPTGHLDVPCVQSLGAFLTGYTLTDSSAAPFIEQLLEEFDGPSGADACSRAYLSFGDTREALEAVIATLQRLIQETDPGPPSPGSFSTRAFVENIRIGTDQGRPRIILGELTVAWMYNYIQGYVAGLDAAAPEEGAAQGSRLTQFEEWLGRKYGSFARWDKLLRVFEDGGYYGIERFLELWDAFEQGVDPHRA